KIRQTVLTGSAPRVTNVNFDIKVGTVVPRTVRVAPLPVTIVEIEPQWRGYMYFVYNDEIIVVEPGSLRIVAVLIVYPLPLIPAQAGIQGPRTGSPLSRGRAAKVVEGGFGRLLSCRRHGHVGDHREGSGVVARRAVGEARDQRPGGGQIEAVEPQQRQQG